MHIATCLLALLFTVTATLAGTPLTVAVFDFNARDSESKDLAPKVSSLLTALLSAEPAVVMIERAELEKALGEQELGLSGTVAADSAARVGYLIGAKILITGTVFKNGESTIAIAKVIGTENGRVYAETATVKSAGTDLTELTETLARKVGTTLTSKSETLVPSVVPREERLSALLEKHKLPAGLAVSVKVPEQHFGAPASDPAAQTQLLSLLQQAGCALVDEKSDQKPDIEIAGEAFSAAGFRKGNLHFCKARLELLARRRSDGKILFTGKQTAVAADITEQTAAKTALENAAFEIAEQLFSYLAKAK